MSHFAYYNLEDNIYLYWCIKLQVDLHQRLSEIYSN